VDATLPELSISAKRPEEGEPIAVSGYPFQGNVLITTSGFIASSWNIRFSEIQRAGAPAGFHTLDVADIYLADIHVNGGNSGGPVYSVETGVLVGVCVSFDDAPVMLQAMPPLPPQKPVPAVSDGRLLTYNSGIAAVVPSTYVIELLKKNNVNWKDYDSK
jgi:S1-C subfamily serine protease